SEERFRELAENIQDAFFVVSGDLSRTLYMSPAYRQIWGRSCGEADSPLPWVDGIHPDDLQRLRGESLWTAAGMSVKRELEFRIVRPGGAVREVGAGAFPVLTEAAMI